MLSLKTWASFCSHSKSKCAIIWNFQVLPEYFDQGLPWGSSFNIWSGTRLISVAAALWVVRSVVYIFILTKTFQCNPYFDQNFCVQPIFWPKVSEQAKSWPILLRTPHFFNKTSLWKPNLWHQFQVKTHDHVPAAKISLIGLRGRDVPMTILLYNGKWVQLTIKPAALDWSPQPPNWSQTLTVGLRRQNLEKRKLFILRSFQSLKTHTEYDCTLRWSGNTASTFVCWPGTETWTQISPLLCLNLLCSWDCCEGRVELLLKLLLS